MPEDGTIQDSRMPNAQARESVTKHAKEPFKVDRQWGYLKVRNPELLRLDIQGLVDQKWNEYAIFVTPPNMRRPVKGKDVTFELRPAEITVKLGNKKTVTRKIAVAEVISVKKG